MRGSVLQGALFGDGLGLDGLWHVVYWLLGHAADVLLRVADQ